MRRRDFTTLAAGTLFTATAGCLGSDESPDDGQSSGTDDSNETDTTTEGGGESDETTIEGEMQTVKYIEAVSGHAVEVEDEDGEREVIRLAGVKTPSTDPSEIDPDEYYGDAFPDADDEEKRQKLAETGEDAERFLKSHLWDPREREEVQLETDLQTPDTDDEGRRMVFMHWVSPYGQNSDNEWHVNRHIVGGGLGRATDTPSKYKDDFHDLVENAGTNQNGYWDFQTR